MEDPDFVKENYKLDMEDPDNYQEIMLNLARNINYKIFQEKFLCVFGHIEINESFLNEIKNCTSLFIEHICIKLDWVPEHITTVSINYLDSSGDFPNRLKYSHYIEELHDNVTILSVYSINKEITKYPLNLKALLIDDRYTFPMDNLPTGLEKLRFSPLKHHDASGEDYKNYFNHELNNLPTGLKILETPITYNKQLSYLPAGLITLVIKGYGEEGYSQELNGILPNGLKNLVLDLSHYNLPLTGLPDSVEHIYFHGDKFDSEFIKPANLKKITIWTMLNHSITLQLLYKYKKEIDNKEIILNFAQASEDDYSLIVNSNIMSCDEIFDIFKQQLDDYDYDYDEYDLNSYKYSDDKNKISSNSIENEEFIDNKEEQPVNNITKSMDTVSLLTKRYFTEDEPTVNFRSLRQKKRSYSSCSESSESETDSVNTV